MSPLPTLHSHTHYQVAQTNSQAKTWQRVCMSHCATDRQSGRKKEQRNANNRVDCPAGKLPTGRAPHTTEVRQKVA